jgi:hypothetical protein
MDGWMDGRTDGWMDEGLLIKGNKITLNELI